MTPRNLVLTIDSVQVLLGTSISNRALARFKSVNCKGCVSGWEIQLALINDKIHQRICQVF